MEWSAGNVVDWMAALNLSPYTELFKSKDIKGAELIALDKEKLGVSAVGKKIRNTSSAVYAVDSNGWSLYHTRTVRISAELAAITEPQFYLPA